ncbi:unnamed protein product [Diatraea saccharalis]|uniref:Pyruvate kinase n=1 Tax=Diatraea saccharalis TaxID=40085 RepID=A0A9N9REI1_9NEOP|nr:unnamed protein product [Diatraea saccharalis]
MLKVEMISATTLTCKIERGGFLGSYKDVFVPNVTFAMSNFTEKDKRDIEMAVKNQTANGIIVTRQELGSDITPKKLVIAQKNMIARANKANIPVLISAHLLSSMRYKKIPLRAELLDIGNCILDGADGLILTAETAVGLYPEETVAYLAGACKEAEACTPLPCDQVTGTALAAVLAAQRVLAAAIVVVTSTGNSAQVIAKYRPRCPIMAVTRYAPIARKLHLWRGIMPIVYEESPDVDWQNDLDKRVNYCIKWAIARGFVRIGDPVVIVSGWRQGSGFTNTMRIVYAVAEG